MLRYRVLTCVAVVVIAVTAACAPQASAPAAAPAEAKAAEPTTAPEASAAPAEEQQKAAEATAAPAPAEPAPEPEATVVVAEASAAVEPVVILVLDNFTFTDQCPDSNGNGRDKDALTNQLEGLLDGKELKNCLLTPDGQVFASRGVWKDCAKRVPHGWFVYQQISELLQREREVMAKDPQGLSFGSPYGELYRLKDDTAMPSDVLLVAVDVPGWSTEEAASELGAALTQLEKSPASPITVERYQITGVKGVVVNMSFAVVPCGEIDITQYVEALLKSDAGDLEPLRTALIKLYLNKKMDPLTQRDDPVWWTIGGKRDGTEVTGWTQKDPLYLTLQPPKDERAWHTIFVAAAGNSGLNFPFVPAMWPEVLSVSAGPESGGTKEDYSNSGDVMISGKLEKVDGSVAQYPDANGVLKDVEGTSFAAPKLAYLSALYLLRNGGVPDCPLPPLKSDINRDQSRFSEWTWLNPLVDKSVSDWCRSFATPTPFP
jgi:hypothetical protein